MLVGANEETLLRPVRSSGALQPRVRLRLHVPWRQFAPVRKSRWPRIGNVRRPLPCARSPGGSPPTAGGARPPRRHAIVQLRRRASLGSRPVRASRRAAAPSSAAIEIRCETAATKSVCKRGLGFTADRPRHQIRRTPTNASVTASITTTALELPAPAPAASWLARRVHGYGRPPSA